MLVKRASQLGLWGLLLALGCGEESGAAGNSASAAAQSSGVVSSVPSATAASSAATSGSASAVVAPPPPMQPLPKEELVAEDLKTQREAMFERLAAVSKLSEAELAKVRAIIEKSKICKFTALNLLHEQKDLAATCIQADGKSFYISNYSTIYRYDPIKEKVNPVFVNSAKATNYSFIVEDGTESIMIFSEHEKIKHVIDKENVLSLDDRFLARFSNNHWNIGGRSTASRGSWVYYINNNLELKKYDRTCKLTPQTIASKVVDFYLPTDVDIEVVILAAEKKLTTITAKYLKKFCTTLVSKASELILVREILRGGHLICGKNDNSMIVHLVDAPLNSIVSTLEIPAGKTLEGTGASYQYINLILKEVGALTVGYLLRHRYFMDVVYIFKEKIYLRHSIQLTSSNSMSNLSR